MLAASFDLISRHPLARVQDYPRSKAVTVHYDPKNPSRAVLEAGPSMRNLYDFLLGVAIVFLAVLYGALALGGSR